MTNSQAGALGALPAETIRATVRTVAARRPTSAAVALTTKTGVDYVKVGFFGESEPLPCIRALRSQTATGVKLVAVLFANLAPNLRVLQALAGAGFWGVMLDTADKQRGGLRDHMSHALLVKFVQQAKQAGLVTGLTGSLTREDIPALLPLKPDYLGSRSALCCRGRRTEHIEFDAITAIRKQIQAPRNTTRQKNRLVDFTSPQAAKRIKTPSRAQ